MPISRKAQILAGRAVLGVPGFPAPWWAGPGAALYLGDVRACLRALPTRSVQCVVTSPPYWGLRDYGTAEWEGGDTECDHVAQEKSHTLDSSSRLGFPADGGPRRIGADNTYHAAYKEQYRNVCGKCDARRTDQQLGMETLPDCLGWATGAPCGECFVCHLVEVFSEVRRVLRDDGTVWIVIGDSYASGEIGRHDTKQGRGGEGLRNTSKDVGQPRAYAGSESRVPSGNLVGVPWRVALALQADGWILRQDIIWSAPNKMPESISNRCTKSHEHIFLLAKGNGYYYDKVAIAEASKSLPHKPRNNKLDNSRKDHDEMQKTWAEDGISNKRDVWIVPTQGYPGAHFACFSPRLITPCILAGTSENGCCAGCGTPYERIVATDRAESRVSAGGNGFGKRLEGTLAAGAQQQDNYKEIIGRETLGWRKVCGCTTDAVTPCVVLDPFVGSGTTVATALTLGRAGVGIDLSEVYLRENAIPRIEAALCGEKVVRKTASVQRAGTSPPPKRLQG